MKLFDVPRILSIEGPIRVGKSTLAGILAGKLHARRIVEPENNPFLDGFYRDQPGMGFATQMWFLMERWEQWSGVSEGKAAKEDVMAEHIVADYIFEKDKLFACLNLSDAELETYNRYYEHFRGQVPTPDLVIYLRASPEVLKARLKRKGVPGERALSDAYLQKVAEAYEHFFFHYKASDLLVVDTTDIDFVHNKGDLQRLLKRISEPIKGTQHFLPV